MKIDNLPQYLYHATYAPALNSIQKYGLGAREGNKIYAWDNEYKNINHIYLAIDDDYASSYAEASDNVPSEWLDNIVLLRVATSDLDLTKLEADPNLDEPFGCYLYRDKIPATKLTLLEEWGYDYGTNNN